MIDELTMNNILKTFDINSSIYGPSIYSNKDKFGLAMDIKDSVYGYLTRIILLDTIEDTQEFLNKYNLALNINEVKISLDNYENKEVKVLFTYNDVELTLNDLQNFEDFKKKQEENKYHDLKEVYLANITYLTKYLNDLNNLIYDTLLNKQKLKRQENDLKFALIEYLAVYYDKRGKYPKKEIISEDIKNNFDNDFYLNKIKELENKDIEEIKKYLEELIKIIKDTELNEKYLISLYSNIIYKYNIEILKKQIDFVKRKIKSEKNFSVKGSKLHNIDEELKSFLTGQEKPLEMNKFIELNRKEINDKYARILDVKDAYKIITHNDLILPDIKKEHREALDIAQKYFANLKEEEKSALILYNSFYQDIIDYIEDKGIKDIENNFNLNYYYKEMENIAYDSKNIQVSKYFNIIDFKNIKTFINSLEEIGKIIKNTFFKVDGLNNLFLINRVKKLKELSFKNVGKLEDNYIVNSEVPLKIMYIPLKLSIDNAKQIEIINTDSVYIENTMEEEPNKQIVNIYEKVNKNKKKDDIIITSDLKLVNSINYGFLEIKGDINE